MFDSHKVLVKKLLAATLLLAFLSSNTSTGDEEKAPIINYKTRFLPEIGKNGMVVGPEKLAAEIGLSILKDGGNAIDAAVATGFALAVTYPRAGNLGGGGFMLIHRQNENQQTLIDYRETAPLGAQSDMFLDESGKVDRSRIYFSHLAAGVPGTVAGLLLALEQYGTLPIEVVIKPAIKLALEGFPVSYALNYEINSRTKRLAENPEAAKLFLTAEKSAPPIGSIFKQGELANTLMRISKEGRDGFYRGLTAQFITDEMDSAGGLITTEDLNRYAAVERTPVRQTFRGYEIVSTPPPSSGGIHIIQMLNILEELDLRGMRLNSATYIHYLTESMKRAYADRSKYLGDSDFIHVPVTELISKEYAKTIGKEIFPNKASPSGTISPGVVQPYESPDTTHFTVADRFGNAVTNTYTLNFSFGSHIAVPGTGLLLNNEMADFAARPGVANAYGLVEGQTNAIIPGKRPLSSMSPTMVMQNGSAILATGSPGGSIIITTVLQVILNSLVFDMNIASAAAQPRVHHQWLPDTLRVEPGIGPDTIDILEQMGHNVTTSSRTLGRTQSIALKDGWLYGATDSRRAGGHVASY